MPFEFAAPEQLGIGEEIEHHFGGVAALVDHECRNPEDAASGCRFYQIVRQAASRASTLRVRSSPVLTAETKRRTPGST